MRVVCLTEETTETLYRIGAGDSVVGVSGYTVRPPEARKKPKVSAFINANFDRIEALSPDLVIGFSDLQADIARELIKRGLNVVIFNQRSVPEILRTIRTTGALVGRSAEANALAAELETSLTGIRATAATLPCRPRVFFEEWHEPLISGIRWVSELIEIAGGEDVFPELRGCQAAKDRVVTPAEVVRRAPEVVIGSWCGRKVRMDWIRNRPGWKEVPAVRNGHLFEVKSTFILQPGPAALTEGVQQLSEIIAKVAQAG
jgi:iron complex transport system substrate-binding protein